MSLIYFFWLEKLCGRLLISACQPVSQPSRKSPRAHYAYAALTPRLPLRLAHWLWDCRWLVGHDFN